VTLLYNQDKPISDVTAGPQTLWIGTQIERATGHYWPVWHHHQPINVPTAGAQAFLRITNKENVVWHIG
jgi:hypothetical protein